MHVGYVLISYQWLFNFVVARATPNMMATMGQGGYGTFFTYGSFCFTMFIFVWFLIPETKAVPLDKMDRLFDIRPCSRAYATVMEELQTENIDRDEMLGKLPDKSEHA